MIRYRDPARRGLTADAAPPAHLVPLVTETQLTTGGPVWVVGAPGPVGPWGPGYHGLECALPTPLPALVGCRRSTIDPETVVMVDLPGFPQVPIASPGADGFVMRCDGTATARPASAYAAAAVALADRIDAKEEVKANDPGALRLAILALQSTHDLPEELIDALGLLSPRGIVALAEAAMTHRPKAPTGNDSSPSSLPASTPPV